MMVSGAAIACMVTSLITGIATYLGAWGTNFIMALPLQLIIVGPFSRYILGLIQN